MIDGNHKQKFKKMIIGQVCFYLSTVLGTTAGGSNLLYYIIN
jgi:hypothetical protein